MEYENKRREILEAARQLLTEKQLQTVAETLGYAKTGDLTIPELLSLIDVTIDQARYEIKTSRKQK